MAVEREEALGTAPVALQEISHRTGRLRRRLGPGLIPYIFILPALFFYTIFLALPIFGTVLVSMLDWSGISLNDIEWAGTANYVQLTQDKVFWQALKHNLIFIATGTSSIVILGLILAVLLERGLPGSNFFRGAFFIPTVMSMVVVGIVFMLILSPELGLINPFLHSVGLGNLAHAWLGDPRTALGTIIASDVWKNFGFAMFLFVAGLKNIDSELYEAAAIDGSNAWQSFWRITMPVLWPVTTLVIILISIGTLKLFDLVYVMTHGGPNHASEVLTTWMYFQGFMYNNMGYGSAIAVVLLAVTFGLTLIQFRVLSRDRNQ